MKCLQLDNKNERRREIEVHNNDFESFTAFEMAIKNFRADSEGRHSPFKAVITNG